MVFQVIVEGCRGQERIKEQWRAKTCREKGCDIEAEEIVGRVDKVTDAGCERRPEASRVSLCHLSLWMAIGSKDFWGKRIWRAGESTSEELGRPRGRFEVEGWARDGTSWAGFAVSYIS